MAAKTDPIGKEFPKEDYSLAFRKLRFHDKLPESYVQILQAHYNAPGRRMTPTQLAEAANWENYNAINLHYGRLGKMVLDEMQIVDVPQDPSTGDPIYTCGVAWGEREDPESEWTWTMYENLAQAIKELGIVS